MWDIFPKWNKKKKELGTREGPVFFWKNMYIQLCTHEKLHLLLKQKTINLSVQRKYDIILVPTVAVRWKLSVPSIKKFLKVY